MMNIITSNQKTLKTPVSRLLYMSLYSSLSSGNSYSRRYEEESRNVRVSVWWDIEKCCFPGGINVFKIGQYISNAVRFNGIKGPIHISAFGDLLCLSRPHQEALSSTGIHLVHVPNGGKNSADRSLLVDLMHWVSQNPPPAHIFLISSDTDFAGILHKLRMSNYNILLASNDGVHTPGVLSSASSIMWHWAELAKGDNFSGRHFNQPPDGPHNSWYGHYRGPLEDPFDVPEIQNTSKGTTTNDEVVCDSPQAIPKAVLKQIRHLIDSCPNGVSSGEFRHLLARNKVVSDKNLYGYRRFSQFVQSMPHVIRVVPSDDGRLYLYPVESSKIEEKGKNRVVITEKSKDGNQAITRMVDFEPKEEKVELKGEVGPENKDTMDSMKENNTIDSKDGIEKRDSEDEVGLLRGLWRKWFRSSGKIEKTTIKVPDKAHSVSVSYEKSISEEGSTVSTTEHEISGKSEVRPGFVTKVLSWFKTGKNESSVNTTTEQSSEKSEDMKHEVEPVVVKLEADLRSSKHELFSKETFWSAFGSFLRTYRASEIISSSKSREQLARRLKNDGPLNLRSLQESDLIQLVDILISERKYIKEFPTRTPRFQPNPPRENSITPVQTHIRNECSALFPSKKPSEKARSEILADCQKLSDELLGQYPEGYNMGLFKNQFLEKYGYALDHQKLGYPKLVSLLQLMSGVKIESARVFPDNAGSEMTDSPLKAEDEYEPSVSDNDDELSEVEEETRVGVKEEDSSLLKILNTWHSPKEDENKRKEVQGSNPNEDKNEQCGKRYTFVADSSSSAESDKDKLIDGILGSLKKSGETRIQS